MERSKRGKPSTQPLSAPTGLHRNDTSFPVKATAKLRILHQQYQAALVSPDNPEHKWASMLKYYQYLVRAVMTDPEYGIGADGNGRGLILHHQMGLGKTRTAVAVATAMCDVRRVVVLLARGLQKNFRSTVEQVARLLGRAAPSEGLITYVSQDAYNAADLLARAGGLDGRLLIVDEAHNFFRAIINSSAENANARRIYDMVMAAHDLRIVFLTGTPAAKNPFELVPCFNMLAGHDLLPTQYETFVSLYVDKERHCVKNRAALANRLVGLVSHVSTARPTGPGDAGGMPKPGDDGWFPVELPTVVERVPMGHHQYRTYLLAREKELAEGKGGSGAGGPRGVTAAPPLALPGSEKKAMRSYYVKSRTTSTFCPPRELAGRPVDEMPDEAFTEETGPKLHLIAQRVLRAPGPVLVYSQFVESALKPLGRFLRRLGFEEFVPGKTGGDAPRPSVDRRARMRAAMRNVPVEEVPTASLAWALDAATAPAADDDPAPLLVVAARPDAFAGDSGTVLREDLPRLAWAVRDGRPTVRVQKIPPSVLAEVKYYEGGAEAPRFAIISGEVATEARDVIRDAAVSAANIHGAAIKAVLVSKTGAEGLDLKYLRETHTVESYWDKAREDQVKFRAIRMGSHDALPRDERVVQPYLYLATANREVYDQMPVRSREESTIDEMFHARALEQYEINADFRKLLAEVSIECSYFGYGDCRVCVPTGALLFHDDPGLDARLPDPCEVCGEADVQATPVEVDGITYYYSADPASPLGYVFYSYAPDLGAYAPIALSDPVVTDILTTIGAV